MAVMEYCEKNLYTVLCEPENSSGLSEDEYMRFFKHIGKAQKMYVCLSSEKIGMVGHHYHFIFFFLTIYMRFMDIVSNLCTLFNSIFAKFLQ